MNLAQHILILAIRGYQRVISPVLSALGRPAGLGCRFTPSCSAYALEAVQQRGAWRGAGLAARRVCRCHPWGGCGHDPVPDEEFKISRTTLNVLAEGRRSASAREPVLGTMPRQNS